MTPSGSSAIEMNNTGEFGNNSHDFSGLPEELIKSIDHINHEVFDIISPAEVPYSKITESENKEILTNLLKYLKLDDFFDTDKIISQIHLGNFSKLIKSLDKLFEEFINQELTSIETSLEQLEKIPYIIKIINSILVLSLKTEIRFDNKVTFIQYFIEKFENDEFEKKIKKINLKIKNTENDEEKKQLTKKIKEIMPFFLIEINKFKRNFSYIIDYFKIDDEKEVCSLGIKTREIIIETNGIVKKYVDNDTEEEQNILIEQILLAITSIENCAYKIYKNIKISYEEGEEAISSYDFIVKYHNIIDFKQIQGAIVISNLKTYRQQKKLEKLEKKYQESEKNALIDPLTQLGNRRNLDNTLAKLVSNLYREKENKEDDILKRSSNYFFMFDIDFFKKVNDTYGHDIGDKVLTHFANILKTNLRMGDNSFRYGGEEFVIITGKMTLEQACKFGEKLRQLIKKTPYIDENGKEIKITISIGISEINSFIEDDNETDTINKTDTIKEIVEKTDKALYAAKDTGRNKCVINAINDLIDVKNLRFLFTQTSEHQ